MRVATMREPDQTPWQIILPKSCTQADQIACHARSIGLPQQPLTGGERSAAEAVTHAKILQTQMSLGVLCCFKTEQSEVADGVSAKNSFCVGDWERTCTIAGNGFCHRGE